MLLLCLFHVVYHHLKIWDKDFKT